MITTIHLEEEPKKDRNFLTGARAFQNLKSVLGASAILVAQEMSIIREPVASERVEVSQG